MCKLQFIVILASLLALSYLVSAKYITFITFIEQKKPILLLLSL